MSGEVNDARENPVLQFGSLILAAVGLLAATVPAVGLSMAVASMVFGLIIPPRSTRLRVITIVFIGVALIANVVALVLALPPTGTGTELDIKPD